VSSEQPEPRRSEELRAVTARWLETADRLDLSALARFSEAHWTGGWGTDVDEVFPTFELAKQYAVVEFEPGGQDAAEGTWHFGPLDIASWVEGSVGWSIASCLSVPACGVRVAGFRRSAALLVRAGGAAAGGP
jgi:hypothetical protein